MSNPDAVSNWLAGSAYEAGHAPRIEQVCPTCLEIERRGGFGPSHKGSARCESGSIASDGTHAHCTCDWCF